MKPRSETAAGGLRASVWDMDGTLLLTDVFAESAVRLCLRKPWVLFLIPLWLLRGRSYCKGRVAVLAKPLWTQWPLRESVVNAIIAARHSGAVTLLATAAHETVAHQVARDTAIFDGVVASDDRNNLKGKSKLAAIRNWATQAGCDRFSYAGDSSADWPIWCDADEAVAVAPSRSVERRLNTLNKPLTVLDRRQAWGRAALRALRPHQWAKNALLFVPMVVGHRFDLQTLWLTVAAFVAFCLTASAIYVLNDLSDLDSDRKHPKKRMRPFAAGALSIQQGVLISGVLLIGASVLSMAALPPAYAAVLAGYFGVNICYSAFLKQRPIVDVLMLATMYVVRLEAGGIAGGIPLSPWLLAFSLFFFTSLALAKRYAELQRVEAGGGRVAAGRGYLAADLDTLLSLGTASGYVAVLVLALYMNSDDMRLIYGQNRLLWLICPIVMYWITRVWLLARRGHLDEDPVVFAFRDKASVAVGLACGVLLILVVAWR